jgi:hypothetical protein
MTHRRLSINTCTFPFALLIALSASPASGQALTIEGHEKAMKEIDYVLEEAEFHIDARYWADLGSDTDALRANFTRVKAFWEGRGTADAVGFVEQALTANSALSRASMASDKAQATTAVGELRAACKACHSEYREKTDDGFRIKPSG